MQLRLKWWRSLLPLLLALGMLIPTAGPSLALDKRPPRAVLRVHGDNVQRGRLIGYCWSYREPGSDYGVTECADGTYSWPDAAKLHARTKASIRFFKAEAPKRVRLSAYEDIGRDDRPKGEGERLAYRLRPVESQGEVVAWDAVFRLREWGRHYYMAVSSRWKEGDAFYNFHAKTFDRLVALLRRT